MPKRVQMRRDRPWRKDNPDAVIVARPSPWGNRYRVGERYRTERGGHGLIKDRAMAVDLFRRHQARWMPDITQLRGKDLACWCPPGEPCHADVLLEIANRPIAPVGG